MPKLVFDHFTQACHMTRTFNTQVSTGGLGTTLGTVIILWSNKRILARFWQVPFRLASLFELWFWCKLNMGEDIWAYIFCCVQDIAKSDCSKEATEQTCHRKHLFIQILPGFHVKHQAIHLPCSGKYQGSTIWVFLASHKIGPTVCSINGRMVKGTSCRAALK